MNNKFYLKRNTFNIDFLYNVISPKDRTDSLQVQKYNSFIFVFALNCIFKHNNIHDIKSSKNKKRICELLGISERTMFRYINSCVELGFMKEDRDNNKNMRFIGMSRIVTDYNNKLEDEDDWIPFYKKCKLNIDSVDMKFLTDCFDTSLIRYAKYNESIKTSFNRVNNLHKSSRNSKDGIMLSYIDNNRGNKYSNEVRNLYEIISDYFGESQKDLNKVIYKSNDGKTINGNSLVYRNIYNRELNKSNNSAIISFYQYYQMISLKDLYNDDMGSYQLGQKVGFTKSGFNSMVKRLTDKGLLESTNKFCFIRSCKHSDYVLLRKRLNEIEKYDSSMKNVTSRIVYKNGNILYQRENHIKIDSDRIKFSWDRPFYLGLIQENMGVVVPERYKQLCDSLEIKQKDGWFEPSFKDKKIKSNQKVLCATTGEILNSYKNIELPDEDKNENVIRLLQSKQGFEYDGNKYFFLNSNHCNGESKSRQYA